MHWVSDAMHTCTKLRSLFQAAVALFLLALSLTAAADVREAERECVQAMAKAVNGMPAVLKHAQERTGKTIVADDEGFFNDMGPLVARWAPPAMRRKPKRRTYKMSAFDPKQTLACSRPALEIPPIDRKKARVSSKRWKALGTVARSFRA